jgi:hypothetical protein
MWIKKVKKTNKIYFDFSRKRENRKKETRGKGKRVVTSGRLEPDGREGLSRNSAWSHQGDEPQSEIDCAPICRN